MLTSLDGYVEDASGKFDWGMPSEEVHEFVNELTRPIGTFVFGRGMYDTMRVWDEISGEGEPPAIGEFAAIWRAADKIVYSRTLSSVEAARSELRNEFDPDELVALKSSSNGDLAIAGPGLAAEAFAAGLVDEVQLTLMPVSVGAGKPALPSDRQLELELIDSTRFSDGAVNLRYAVKR